MTEQMNVPKLRFGDFEGDWNAEKLGAYSKHITYGLTVRPKFVEDGIPLISAREITSGEVKYSQAPQISLSEFNNLSDKAKPIVGDLFLSKTGTIGFSAQNITSQPVAITQNIAVIRMDDANVLSPNYVLHYFKTKKFYRSAISKVNQSTIMDLQLGDIKRLPIPLPPNFLEQQKIASFLTKVDEKITLLTEKKGKLTEYKKGVMQQLFNGKWDEQDGQLNFIPPTLRFKADDGSEFPDWEEKKLGQVFTRIRRKNKENNQNVLTISAQQGLINQEKYFNKSVAAKDVTGYYLLENGDFAYNKSYSKGYPMGAIKRLNNYDKGVVSTLYICFGLNQGFVSDFFEHYFESGLQNRDLSKIAQEGARNHGLLNISVDEFFKDVKLLTPSHDEQLKIANFLSAIDQKIHLANSELEKANEWKKGLLQQMFV